MLGFDRERKIINVGDTADLYAYLYDDNDAPIDPTEIASVQFTIQKPDQTKDIQAGAMQTDGAGFLLYQATQQGQYIVVATFTFNDGRIQSTQTNFEVADPFAPLIPANYD